MYSFGELISHPFPRFVFECLLLSMEEKGSKVSDHDRSKILAVKAICRGELSVLLEMFQNIWKQGDKIATSASVFQAAYRVAPFDDVLAMVRPVMAELDLIYPNKTQVHRTETALTRGARTMASALAATPSLIPKQVILLEGAAIENGPLPIKSVTVDSAEVEAELLPSPADAMDGDPEVVGSHIEKTLEEWRSRVENGPKTLKLYRPMKCVTTGWYPTPMIEDGQALAALGPCIEHYHHARWIGATLTYSRIEHEIKEAIVLPRVGTGYHYHQVVDHLAAIITLEGMGFDKRQILVPDDLSKFTDVLANVEIDSSRLVAYHKGFPARVHSPVMMPIAPHSRAKITRARARLFRASRPKKAGTRIYISRSKSNQRPLVNESDVEAIVAAAGYEILHFEALSISDQILAVDNAHSIIAPHGGGLANLMFARGPIRLLELMPETYFVDVFYRLARMCGFRYSIYVGAADPSVVTGNNKGAWKVDLARFRRAVAKFEESGSNR